MLDDFDKAAASEDDYNDFESQEDRNSFLQLAEDQDQDQPHQKGEDLEVDSNVNLETGF